MLGRQVWFRIDEKRLTTNLTVTVFKDNTLKKSETYSQNILFQTVDC